MDRNQANVILAAILETVAEEPKGAPSGVMYAAMLGKVELPDYEMLLGIARDTGLVRVESHLVTITAKGRQVVEKIRAHRVAS